MFQILMNVLVSRVKMAEPVMTPSTPTSVSVQSGILDRAVKIVSFNNMFSSVQESGI